MSGGKIFQLLRSGYQRCLRIGGFHPNQVFLPIQSQYLRKTLLHQQLTLQLQHQSQAHLTRQDVPEQLMHGQSKLNPSRDNMLYQQEQVQAQQLSMALSQQLGLDGERNRPEQNQRGLYDPSSMMFERSSPVSVQERESLERRRYMHPTDQRGSSSFHHTPA
ncbi:hypothetical protein KIW84_033687 [Lathyrus oleraceus]|uniref:Uncharacterized protein n=1 Tax=Pisum sativum TaxID=3888 RepID=A0A9D4XX91_PEA|nr:hypothetical protein KIW84_033687 [Pisum sativum]